MAGILVAERVVLAALHRGPRRRDERLAGLRLETVEDEVPRSRPDQEQRRQHEKWHAASGPEGIVIGFFRVRGRVLRRVAKAPRVRLLRLHAAQPVAAAAWDESLMAVWALERAGAHLHSAPQWDLKGEMRQHSEPSTSYPPAVAFHLFGLDTPIFVFNRPMD